MVKVVSVGSEDGDESICRDDKGKAKRKCSPVTIPTVVTMMGVSRSNAR